MNTIVFEVIPPPKSFSSEKVVAWVRQLCDILSHHQHLYLNLPEVVSEEREGERQIPLVDKMDNLEFMQLVQRQMPEVIPILNKISVRMNKETFIQWVSQAYELGVRHLIIVGGDTHKLAYPGYSVVEAAQQIKRLFPDITLGGITIFTRPNEAARIIEKMENGIEFFVSQIIFESANMKQVLVLLEKSCRQKGLAMPAIYASLAPASTEKDIAFMQWLGVEFPSAVLSHLLEGGDRDVEANTFEVIDRVLEEIFHFMETEHIQLGFNIEYLRYTNLELAEKVLRAIESRKAP